MRIVRELLCIRPRIGNLNFYQDVKLITRVELSISLVAVFSIAIVCQSRGKKATKKCVEHSNSVLKSDHLES